MPEPRSPVHPAGPAAVLPALIAGQVGLHATMAGVRMAAPLQALRDGQGAWSVGMLMALYAAAPVLLSMQAGRMADRFGYHRPVRIAIGLALGGVLAALAGTFAAGAWRFGWLCLSAVLVGSGANLALIVTQRSAALATLDATARMRLFSWLGIAPPLANVIGPVAAGFAIDAGGFGAAYAAMLALPLVTLACNGRVPRDPVHAAAPRAGLRRTRELWAAPGMRELLAINLLLSACWDVHAFAVPLLGFERGFAASTIGLILGTFTLAVTGVRLLIPLWAHRMQPVTMLGTAMLATAAVFALYPLAQSPWLLGGCAVLLGLALGSVQPMIMSTLHELTPPGRHGESIALRAMVMNASSTALPLAFGAAGASLGAGALFWLVGAAVAAGSWLTRVLRRRMV